MTRLFVGNLPPKASEEELLREFGSYGVVSSVEIKVKENANNSSSRFAFVTLEMDNSMVQQCIQEFKEMPFHGHYLTVSVAKESFLEKLKREREEAAKEEAEKKRPKAKKTQSQDESEEFVVRKNTFRDEMKAQTSELDDETFLVKKRGQGARIVNGMLKIIGDPLFVANGNSQPEPSEKDPRALMSEQKRLESLNRKKNAYNQQKFAIKAALASGQKSEQGKKIVFGDNEEAIKPTKLLDDDDDDDEEVDFSVRQQFQGKSGQKLLNLQSKFQGDKRFALSEDFREDGNKNIEEKGAEDVDDERKKQMEILEGVVGHSLTSSKPKQTFQAMLRYDPTKKDHEKYIRKDMDADLPAKQVRREEAPVQVSSEKFYKVDATGIEQSFKSGSEGFSLLKMLGRDSEPQENYQETSYATSSLSKTSSGGKRFRHDSTDEEEDSKKKKKLPTDPSNNKTGGKKNKRGIFRESFFIQAGDSRLQEGAVFFRSLSQADGDQFQEKRQQLKQIVRRKIKKNQLKANQKFPKKKFIGKTKKNIKK